MEKLYKEYCKTYKLTSENSDGFLDIVGDLLHSDEVQSLQIFEQHLDIDRLQHITSVAYISYQLSKKFKLNYKSAARAAVLHDLVYYDWRDGVNGKWHKLHGYKHPRLAVMNSKELYPDLSALEEDIIKKHMWPLTVIPPKYLEGFIVTFADKYCAAREVYYSKNLKYKNKFLKDVEVL